ncbi:Protein of unknown function [Gryllus bimaculatus]|nr:Protein of unknown function [Gryllus bimaculatus]
MATAASIAINTKVAQCDNDFQHTPGAWPAAVGEGGGDGECSALGLQVEVALRAERNASGHWLLAAAASADVASRARPLLASHARLHVADACAGGWAALASTTATPHRRAKRVLTGLRNAAAMTAKRDASEVAYAHGNQAMNAADTAFIEYNLKATSMEVERQTDLRWIDVVKEDLRTLRVKR